MAMNLLNLRNQNLLASGEFQHPPDNEERANANALAAAANQEKAEKNEQDLERTR